jgi:NitT/TauT family transport system substrate-binding protein
MTRRGRVAAAALGLAAALGGCAPSSPPGTAQQSGDLPTVRVVLPGVTNFTVGVPFYVARDQGLFAKHRVSVIPTITSGGGTNVQAVIGGNADVGVDTGLAAIATAYVHGAQLKVIAACTTGLDANFLSKADSPYRTLADLAGAKVGFTSPGSSSQVAVNAISDALRAAGRAPVQALAVGGAPDQLTAVQTGQIAAGFAPPPTFLDRVDSGQLRLVVTGLAEFTAYKDVVSRAIFADAGFTRGHPDAVKGFLGAWQEAWQWSFTHQDQAIDIFKRGSNAQDTPATLKKAFSSYSPRTQRLTPISGIDRTISDAVRNKVLDKALTSEQLAALVDTGYAVGLR